jgi:hypothetical protein
MAYSYKPRIFGGYYGAHKNLGGSVSYTTVPIIRSATSLEEALGMGLLLAREQLPAADGWQHHVCDMVELPSEFVAKQEGQ